MKTQTHPLMVVSLLVCLGTAATVSADEIVVWGLDSHGQKSNAPSGNDFIDIAAGQWHVIALRQDQSIVSWGSRTDGQAPPPYPIRVVKIVAGDHHNIALWSDGTVHTWGSDAYNQVTDSPTGYDFVDIAAGSYHCLALRADGSIVGWGRDAYGEASPPPGYENAGFDAVGAGWYHSFAMRDGRIIGWGGSDYGQINAPSDPPFSEMAVGTHHILALQPGGSMSAAGSNEYGEAIPLSGWGFLEIAAGTSYSMAINANHEVVVWGFDRNGQISDPDRPMGRNVWRIAAGAYHCVALVTSNSEYPFPIVEATLDINPDTLNLGSEGQWITCYLTLPEAYEVEDVYADSILLNELIAPAWSMIDEEEQVLILKFDRAQAQEMLVPGEVPLMISGLLTGDVLFEAFDTIYVIDPTNQ